MTGRAVAVSIERSRPAVTVAIWFAVAIVMAMLAAAYPISIDEGQFVGPAAVNANARPFVDFLYLQTPLQA